MSLSNPTLDALLSSPIGPKWSAANCWRGSYTQEIQQMMFGLGDYHKPLFESAQLIEEIVHQQMTTLLALASDVAVKRGSRFVGIEEIVFLMRCDKLKLCRLVKFLSIKDMKSVVKANSFDEDEQIESALNSALNSVDNVSSNSGEDMSSKCQQTKRVKLCYDFLNSIDETGSLLVVFDDNFVDTVKHERNLRRDRMANSMSASHYLSYCDARQTSFANKARPTKFRDWLLRDSQIESKPNTFALEVLQYLAYETVAQIVDLSLLVKQDSDRDVCDQLTSLLPNKMTNDDFPLYQCDTRHSNDINDDFKLNSSQTSSFFPSPQSKPIQKKSLINSEPNKSKKRKRETNISLESSHSNCITPNHIREAMRRYYTPSGPFVAFHKLSNRYSLHNNKLLCI